MRLVSIPLQQARSSSHPRDPPCTLQSHNSEVHRTAKQSASQTSALYTAIDKPYNAIQLLKCSTSRLTNESAGRETLTIQSPGRKYWGGKFECYTRAATCTWTVWTDQGAGDLLRAKWIHTYDAILREFWHIRHAAERARGGLNGGKIHRIKAVSCKWTATKSCGEWMSAFYCRCSMFQAHATCLLNTELDPHIIHEASQQWNCSRLMGSQQNI